MKKRGTSRTAIQTQKRRRAMADELHQKQGMVDGDGNLEVPWGLLLGIYQIGITSDVVLNQQARVAHQGGMADCLPGGPVAGETMTVLDAGAHGGSEDRPMAGCLVVHA
jgi:hypothetical protein